MFLKLNECSNISHMRSVLQQKYVLITLRIFGATCFPPFLNNHCSLNASPWTAAHQQRLTATFSK